jgi:hypothetical protein
MTKVRPTLAFRQLAMLVGSLVTLATGLGLIVAATGGLV